MQIDYLKNRQEFIPKIAKWYLDEWAYLMPQKSLKEVEVSLSIYLNIDQLPLMLIAIDDNKIVGTVQLKFREMSIYPNKEHWLGGVYVEESARGKDVAALMINELLVVAKNLGVELLHLQTLKLDGGLYKKLAWQAIEQVNYRNEEVLIMERRL